MAVLVLGITIVLSGCSVAQTSATDAPGCDIAVSSSGVVTGPSSLFAFFVPVPSPARTAVPAAPAPTKPYALTGATDLSAEARRARPLVYVPEPAGRHRPDHRPEDVCRHRHERRAELTGARGPVARPAAALGQQRRRQCPDPHRPPDRALGRPVPVRDPYNLYFTPDGKYALVMAERLRRVDVRDARTMALKRSLPVPCKGVNHADFTADLTRLLVSCEFSGQLALLDASATRVIRTIDLNRITTPGATDPSMARSMGGPAGMLASGASSMPQDVRLAPDGRSFLVADMLRNGLWVIDATTFTVRRFVPTGRGRARDLPGPRRRAIFVSNRDEGSVSVLDAATLRRLATWRLPGGSPDMGGVTANGRELWFSGRYDASSTSWTP